ncbi:unnamed protein product [Phytomonas sp. EM1]|nr:unnamed protein product [Phytomonas sp. EM1]|eukprot:CCW64790.1 unnamed protein product [Phytomonas sp. isolate EM1]
MCFRPCHVLRATQKRLLGTINAAQARSMKSSTFSLVNRKPTKAATPGLQKGELNLDTPFRGVSLSPSAKHEHVHIEKEITGVSSYEDVQKTSKRSERMTSKNGLSSSQKLDSSKDRDQVQLESQSFSLDSDGTAGDTNIKLVEGKRSMRSLLLLVLECAAGTLGRSNCNYAAGRNVKATVESSSRYWEVTTLDLLSENKPNIALNLTYTEVSGIQSELIPSLREAVDLFSRMFAATLQSARPRSMLRYCAMSRIACSASPSSCSNDLSSVFSIFSAGNTWSQSAEALKVSEVQILEESLRHIATRSYHVLQSDVSQRATFVRQLVDSIDAAVIPMGIPGTQMNFVRDRSGENHQRPGKNRADMNNDQRTISKLCAQESLSDILEMLALKLHLAYVLLGEHHYALSGLSTDSEPSRQERRWRVDVGRDLLRVVSSDDRIYEFCTLAPVKKGQIDLIRHKKIKGFGALLSYAIQIKTADAKQTMRISHQRELMNKRTALHHVLSLYLSMLPDIVAARCGSMGAQCPGKAGIYATNVAGVLEPGIDDASNSIHEHYGGCKEVVGHGQPEGEELRVLSSLSEVWFTHQHALRIEGAAAAIDWLRLVPVLMTSMANIVERSLELASLSPILMNPSENREEELNRLMDVSQKLSLLLNNMLFYDSSAFDATRQFTPSNTVVESGNNHCSESATEDMDDDPVQRFRRKRSIFNKGRPSDGGVLREVGGVAASVPPSTDRFSKGGHSRFTVRDPSRLGGQAIEGVTHTYSHAGRVEEGSSALFRILVLSQDAVQTLVTAFPFMNSHGQINLSEIWIDIIHAMGRLQQLLYGNPPSLQTHLVSTQSNWDSKPSKGIQSLTRGDNVKFLSDKKDGKERITDLDANFVTDVSLDRFPHLLALTTRCSNNELQCHCVLNIVCSMQKMIPLRLFDSTLRMANTLMQALLVLHEKIKQREPQTTVRSTSFYRDVIRQRDELQFFLLLGGQELLWGNSCFAFAKGIQMAWKMRLALCCGASYTSQSALSSSVLAQKVSQVVVQISRLSFEQSNSIPSVIKTSIEILKIWTFSSADGFPTPCRVPLSVFGAQMCAVCILVGASVMDSVHRRDRIRSVAPLTSSPPGTTKGEAIVQLIELFSSNYRLLLMCCYPAFLHKMHEVMLRVMGPHEELVTQFIVRHLLPVSTSMVLMSLHNSRNCDTPNAHAFLCEQTLLLLAVLSHFAEYPNINSKEGGRINSNVKELLQPWSNILMSISIYCLRLSKGQKGIVQSGDLHFGAPFLPPLSSLPTSILEDVSVILKDLLTLSKPLQEAPHRMSAAAAEGVQYTIDFEIPDDSTRSFLRFLHHCNGLFPSTAFHWSRGDHVNQILDALRVYSLELESSASFSVFTDIVSSSAMDRTNYKNASDEKRTQWLRDSTTADVNHPMTNISDALDNKGFVSFERQREMSQCWYGVLSAVQVASTKRIAPAALHQHPFNAKLLEKLMRFLAKNARQYSKQNVTHAQSHGTALSNTGTIAATNEACLTALDYMGHINADGGWPMVYWIFGIAEVGVAAEKVGRGRVSETTRSIVVSSIFHQLRAVPPPPRDNHAMPGTFSYLAKVLVSLSDMLSKEGSVTLLGIGRSKRLAGLLAEPSADDLRTIIFAIKQSVLYIESGTQPLRSTRRISSGELDLTEEDEITFETTSKSLFADTDRQSAFSGPSSGEAVAPYYVSVLKGDGEGISRVEEKRVEFRQLMQTFVVAFDVILDCILHHLLRQGAMQEDLMTVVAMSYNLLCRVFRECVWTFTELPTKYRSSLTKREFGMLLWTGLSIVATVSSAWHVDNHVGTIFFADRVLQSSQDLVRATQRLINYLHPDNTLEAGYEASVELYRRYPVCCTLIHSLRDMTQSTPSNINRRIGAANRHSTNDNFTAVLATLQVLLGRASMHAATAGIAQKLWEKIYFELASVADAQKHHLRKQKETAESADSDTIFLQVPSLTELEWVLKAVKNIVPTSNNNPDAKKAVHGSEALSSSDCGDTNFDDLLLAFRENTAMLVPHCKATPSEGNEQEDGSLMADTTIVHDSYFPPYGSAFEIVEDLCVEDILASKTLPVGKVVDIVIQQAKSILLLGSTRSDFSQSVLTNKVWFDSPHTQQQVSAYVRNLLGLFSACPLATICQNPGVEELFASFRVLVDMEAMEEGSAKDLVPASRFITLGRCRTETLLSIKQLWRQLCHKVHSELIAPKEAEFHKQHKELTAFVHAYLGGQLRGKRSSIIGSGTDMFTFNADDVRREEQELLSILSTRSTVPRSLATDPNAAYEALLFHEADVIRGLPSSAAADSAPLSQSTQSVDPVLRMAVSKAKLLEKHLPLGVVFTLLRVLSERGSKSDEFCLLAEAVCTYVSRQYVLLRPRLEDTALDVLPLLGFLQPWLGCIQAERDRAPRPEHTNLEGEGKEKDRLDDVIARCEIPSLLASANRCAERVRGIFFRPKLRAQLRRYFAEASGTKGEVGISLEKSKSEEILAYEYIRAVIVYLHLLGLQIVALSRFNLQGSIVEELELFLRQQNHDRIQSAKRRKAQPGAASEEETVQGVNPSASLPISVLLHGDYPPWTATHRAAMNQVNVNPFVAALQHFANVSFVLLRHTDCLTHFVAVQAMFENDHHASSVASPSDKLGTRCAAFADELRHLVANSLQGVFKTILDKVEHASAPLARTVVHHLISRFPCEAVVSNPAVLSAAAKTKDERGDLVQLWQRWRFQRPEWFVTSPSMLEILTPSFFARCLSTSHMSKASAPVISSIATSLLVYAQRKDIALSPLLMATTALLGTTSNRSTAVRLLCENLAQEMLRREDFLQALAPPTVATPTHGAAGSVSNEVLIPFLAAIAREDIQVSKRTLAALLHTAMRMRADVFGEPPTANRQGNLSLLRPLNRTAAGSGGLLHQTHSPGLSPSPFSSEDGANSQGGAEGVAPHTTVSHQQVHDVEGEELSALGAFTIHQSDASALTHRQALERLNISLPATFEVAMHMQVMRRPNKEEYQHATSMLKAADDARRERIRACSLPVSGTSAASLQSSPSCKPLDGGQVDSQIEEDSRGKLDAALHLEDYMDYGVALLHLRFALRKIVHASFRRLARHQLPRTLADMAEALYEIDRPSFAARQRAQQKRRGTGNATCAGHGTLRDPMLIATLRVFSARAILCAQSIGYSPNGTPIVLRSTSSADPTQPRAEGSPSPLLLPPHSPSSGLSTRHDLKSSTSKVEETDSFASPTGLPKLKQEDERQKIAVESNAAIAVSSSGMHTTKQTRLRIMHALSSMKRKRVLMGGDESIRGTALAKRQRGRGKGDV